MRITARPLFLLGALPSALAAQVASTRPVQVIDLGWIAPVVAQARGVAAVALSQAPIAMAAVQPALARARASLIQAQAALAASGASLEVTGLRGLSGLQGLEGLQGLQGLTLVTMADDFDQLAAAPPEPWAQQDPADQLYRDARSALNRQRWGSAADLFQQIYTKYPRSSYAGDAYYWQAYALSKRDTDEALHKALDVLRLQREKAPGATTRSDAETLATRIRGRLANTGNAAEAAVIAETAKGATTVSTAGGSVTVRAGTATVRGGGRGRDKCDSEDDVQTAALNALQQMDADRAMPILRKVLARRDEGSECLRRKAMFIVSQHESRESEQILLDAARSDPDQEVREQAVFWLSQVDSPTAVAALDSILRSAKDPVLQEKAIFALSQQDSPKARQALRDFALRTTVSDELREKAIFWIGQGDDPDRLDFLKTVYAQVKNDALKDKVLFSISQIEGRESAQWLLGIANDVNEDIELRKKALFWVGQSDYPLSELSTLYDRMPSRDMKEQLIFVYSQRSEKAAVDRLIQIARTEKDVELRKKAIFWLSQSSDPRVAEFLASLLEKP